MLITTCPESKFTMLIAGEVRDYFESLIKPLATNESLEKPLGSFQEKIVKRFEEKLDEQNGEKIIELQSKIAIQDNALQRLEIKCDDKEQYVRRSCIASMVFNIMKMMILVLEIKLNSVVMKPVSNLIWMR